MNELRPLDTRPRRVKLRVDDYLALDRAGAFADYAKTELVDGTIYDMSPQHRRHGYCKDELAYRLRRALETLGSTLHVATEQSVAVSPESEPQPDLILTTEPRGEGPIPVASVALIVEVSDTTIAFDLNNKARVYAVAGVPEYWVADLEARVIHLRTVPAGGAYAGTRSVAFGNPVLAETIADLTVETSGL